MRGKKEIKPSRRRSEVAKSKPKSPEVVKVKWRDGLIGGGGDIPPLENGGDFPLPRKLEGLIPWKKLGHKYREG